MKTRSTLYCIQKRKVQKLIYGRLVLTQQIVSLPTSTIGIIYFVSPTNKKLVLPNFV